MSRGRKRRFHPSIPAHIDQQKLPNRCYWHKGKSPHWYTIFYDERGKPRRKKIAGPDARLSELHRIIEEWNGIDRNSFLWLSDQYFDSERYLGLAKSTQTGYRKSASVIAQHPTRLGQPLSAISLHYWDSYLVQRLVDDWTSTRGPSAAKHLHSFIRLVFKWAKNRGYCETNPAIGIELPKERKRQRLPSDEAYMALLNYAKENASHGFARTGSCAHYLWPMMELEYLCRMRGIECRSMTEDCISDKGVLVRRAKGSRNNLVQWNPRLKSAIKYALKTRDEIWAKKRMPIPVKAENRLVLVNASGDRIREGGYHSVWQRFIRNAIAKGIINAEDRFSMHDLKRKGVTDTPGNRKDKQDASGHRSEQMLDVYDKSVPLVKPASE